MIAQFKSLLYLRGIVHTTKLIMEQKSNRGGRRENAGRPASNRKVRLLVRISQEASDKLQGVPNKSEFIDTIIKETL